MIQAHETPVEAAAVGQLDLEVSSAPSTTWALVSTIPSSRNSTPEPVDRPVVPIQVDPDDGGAQPAGDRLHALIRVEHRGGHHRA